MESEAVFGVIWFRVWVVMIMNVGFLGALEGIRGIEGWLLGYEGPYPGIKKCFFLKNIHD